MRALRSAHFESARIGIAQAGENRVPNYGRAAFDGVVGGAIGCGLIGFIIGAISSAIIGPVPWLQGGWFVPIMLGAAGAATGAVSGLLMSQSATERGALYYDEEVSGGRTLVTVYADRSDVAEIRQILLREGAFDAAPIEAPMRKAS
jgi:hypothetical protein